MPLEVPIEFFTEDVEYEVKNQSEIKGWLAEIIGEYSFELESLNYILCSDEYLHQMNIEYLNHNTLTDVITFDNSDVEGIIEGDVFISIDRVIDNAQSMQLSTYIELHRVIIHGLLHLLGFSDKTEEKMAQMRLIEDKCLAKLKL